MICVNIDLTLSCLWAHYVDGKAMIMKVFGRLFFLKEMQCCRKMGK
jgi:hypothetical protein